MRAGQCKRPSHVAKYKHQSLAKFAKAASELGVLCDDMSPDKLLLGTMVLVTERLPPTAYAVTDIHVHTRLLGTLRPSL